MVPDDSQLLVDVRVGIGDDMGQGDLLAGYEYLDDALLVLGLKYLLWSVGHSHSLLSRQYANLFINYITTYVPAVATFLPRHLLPNLFGVG